MLPIFETLNTSERLTSLENVSEVRDGLFSVEVTPLATPHVAMPSIVYIDFRKSVPLPTIYSYIGNEFVKNVKLPWKVRKVLDDIEKERKLKAKINNWKAQKAYIKLDREQPSVYIEPKPELDLSSETARQLLKERARMLPDLTIKERNILELQ